LTDMGNLLPTLKKLVEAGLSYTQTYSERRFAPREEPAHAGVVAGQVEQLGGDESAAQVSVDLLNRDYAQRLARGTDRNSGSTVPRTIPIGH